MDCCETDHCSWKGKDWVLVDSLLDPFRAKLQHLVKGCFSKRDGICRSMVTDAPPLCMFAFMVPSSSPFQCKSVYPAPSLCTGDRSYLKIAVLTDMDGNFKTVDRGSNSATWVHKAARL